MSAFRQLTASPDDGDLAIQEAAAVLRAGGLVAFPTETVYGLGANALDAVAVARIFAAKGRPASNPLIVHVADVAAAKQVVAAWPPIADRLAGLFWPGPLTLVLSRADAVPASVTAGLPCVGVRVPAHPVARALLRAAGVPVAAPSANPYMGVSPTTAAHVAAGLGAAAEAVLILDGGASAVGLESTVLDLTRDVPTVLRLGGVSVATLRAVLGEVAVLTDSAEALPSPGLAKRHYAPRARLRLLGRDRLGSEARACLARGEAVAVMVRGAWAEAPVAVNVAAMAETPEAYGAELYATLHRLDASGPAWVLVEAPPADEAWDAVRDRLRRGAEPG